MSLDQFKNMKINEVALICRIAMVILAYFGPMGKLKFQFSHVCTIHAMMYIYIYYRYSCVHT